MDFPINKASEDKDKPLETKRIETLIKIIRLLNQSNTLYFVKCHSAFPYKHATKTASSLIGKVVYIHLT